MLMSAARAPGSGSGRRWRAERSGSVPSGSGRTTSTSRAPLDEILHIYLPAERFDHLAALYGDARIRADAVRYLAGVEDPLLVQIGLSIHQELIRESSAGRMMVEAAALALTARIAQAYGHDRPETRARPATDAASPDRINRAVAFIRDNLERDLSVAEIAAVACLSPFHFTRMFKRVTGENALCLRQRRKTEARTPITDRA